MLTDTHAHIIKSEYEDYENIIKKLENSEVKRIFNMGCDYKTSLEVLDTLDNNLFYGFVGLHPENINNIYEEELNKLQSLYNNKKVIGVGEIGLDYYYSKDNKDVQKKVFDAQLKFAEENNLFVSIHSREATLDTIEILKKHHVKGIIHSFSGSLETANIYIKMGLLLGVNGIITFKNCKIKDIIKQIDPSNLVVETDSPYLSPEPVRGTKNNPQNVVYTAKFLAELFNLTYGEMCNVLESNINRYFDIK